MPRNAPQPTPPPPGENQDSYYEELRLWVAEYHPNDEQWHKRLQEMWYEDTTRISPVKQKPETSYGRIDYPSFTSVILPYLLRIVDWLNARVGATKAPVIEVVRPYGLWLPHHPYAVLVKQVMGYEENGDYITGADMIMRCMKNDELPPEGEAFLALQKKGSYLGWEWDCIIYHTDKRKQKRLEQSEQMATLEELFEGYEDDEDSNSHPPRPTSPSPQPTFRI